MEGSLKVRSDSPEDLKRIPGLLIGDHPFRFKNRSKVDWVSYYYYDPSSCYCFCTVSNTVRYKRHELVIEEIRSGGTKLSPRE